MGHHLQPIWEGAASRRPLHSQEQAQTCTGSHAGKCSRQCCLDALEGRPRSSSSGALETNLPDKKLAWGGARELGKATRTMGYVTHLCEIRERDTAVTVEWGPPPQFAS